MGVESALKENNRSLFSCDASSMERILDTWTEIKKQGLVLEQMGMTPEKASEYGEKIGSDFAHSEFSPLKEVQEEKKDVQEGVHAEEEKNSYLEAFISSFEDYIKDNDIPPEKAAWMREVYECCSDLIYNFGNEAISEGKSEGYIGAVASGHGLIAAFAADKSDVSAPSEIREDIPTENEEQPKTEGDPDNDSKGNEDNEPDSDGTEKKESSDRSMNERMTEYEKAFRFSYEQRIIDYGLTGDTADAVRSAMESQLDSIRLQGNELEAKGLSNDEIRSIAAKAAEKAYDDNKPIRLEKKDSDT